MITVSILINGHPIFTRSAVNQSKKDKDGNTLYKTDCDHIIKHKPDDGAIVLAKKMLDLITEE
jgi:hypothetical protein